MALGSMVAGAIPPARSVSPLDPPVYRSTSSPSCHTPEAELAYSGQCLIPIKSLCLREEIRSACAKGGHASVSGGLQLLQKTAQAEACATYSYENTFRRSEQAAPGLLCGPGVPAA